MVTGAPRTALPSAENYPYKGYGFCSGDSGGPLIVDGGRAANDRQVGIVSWGPANCGEAENTPCERACCEQLVWRAGWAVSLGKSAHGSGLEVAWPAVAARPPCSTPSSSPLGADVYTDVGAVFNWINGAVYNLTNEWLVPPTPGGLGLPAIWLLLAAHCA